jgi:hypothetical protein
MPNPLAYYAHYLPAWVHHIEVALTFFEQLILPFFILVPRPSDPRRRWPPRVLLSALHRWDWQLRVRCISIATKLS